MKWFAVALFCLLGAAVTAAPSAAQEAASLRAAIDALGDGNYKDRAGAITALAALGDPAVTPVLEALAAGQLYRRKSDGAVFIAERDGKLYKLSDPLSGEAAGKDGRRAVKKIKVNNAMRRAVRDALGALTLRHQDPAVRAAAAEVMFNNGDPASIEMLTAAIAAEEVAEIRETMRTARAAAVLNSDAGEAEKLAAVMVVAVRVDRAALAVLARLQAGSEGALRQAASDGIATIEERLLLWDVLQNVWYGISLGSVLLLAALGLAITFGVMGVINMAHGEMVMLGAYTTYVVQEIFRSQFPSAFDYSLLVAIPTAFAVAGLVGLAIERGVIRFLYGRPLETLLATWGLSLILQQAVRSIFGASNRKVGTPSWISGSVELFGGVVLTSNRIWIVVFAILVFALLTLVIRRTQFGLQMRAVTQNRPMANAVGIRSGWVDALTFGLGSAIAGMAGVALSQIDNVSPNLGQSYIIDSFLVVVFGGVGNLWGTLLGALSLGVANKFLEPYAGAVLGKIVILVAVILFIQKRPRGLFALKSRAVEA